MEKLTREKYIVDEEFKRLIYAAKTRPHVHASRDLALLATAAGAALRVQEAISLRHADLMLLGKTSLLSVMSVKKRRYVRDDVSLPSYAVVPLLAYVRSLPDEARLSHLRVFPMQAWQAGQIFKFYSKLANLSPNYTFHALRHYRGLSLYNESKDIVFVKEFMRHESITSTQIYVHVVDVMEKAAKMGIAIE